MAAPVATDDRSGLPVVRKLICIALFSPLRLRGLRRENHLQEQEKGLPPFQLFPLAVDLCHEREFHGWPQLFLLNDVAAAASIHQTLLQYRTVRQVEHD